MHAQTHKSVHSHIFISHCFVVASNSRCSHSSGFPNYPQPHLPASNSKRSQRLNHSTFLTNSFNFQPTNSPQLDCPTYNTDCTENTLSLLLFMGHCIATAVVWFFVSQSLPSDRSACRRFIAQLYTVCIIRSASSRKS
jgi:hypothetical protein